MKSIFAFLGLLTITSTALPASGASVSCERIFPVIAYGQLKADFKHNTKYTVDFTRGSRITNQCNLGTCHIHSWVGALERDYRLRTNQEIKISADYLSAAHWLKKSLAILNADNNNVAVNLGTDSVGSRDLILRYGIVPESVWRGSQDIQKGVLASRLEEYIQNIIGHAKWKKSQEQDPQKQKALIEEASSEIARLFANFVGDFPREFIHQGKTYNPLTFAAEFFPEVTKPLVQMSYNFSNPQTTIVSKSAKVTEVDTTVQHIAETARALLDKGENIYFAYDHNGLYIDEKTGIMSIAAFRTPVGGELMSREKRQFFATKAGSHGVQLVGYDLDPQTGKVIKWKIRNSWGDKAGDQGVYHMYDDYFRAFVIGLTFNRDAKVELPKPNFVPLIQRSFAF